MLFSLVACSSRTAVDPVAFTAACTEVGLKPVEADPAALAEANMSRSITATGESANCQLLVLNSDSDAKAIYAQVVASMTSANATVEKKVDSSTYSKLFTRTGDKFQAVVRVNNSVFYGQEDTPNGIIEQILEIIKYK